MNVKRKAKKAINNVKNGIFATVILTIVGVIGVCASESIVPGVFTGDGYQYESPFTKQVNALNEEIEFKTLKIAEWESISIADKGRIAELEGYQEKEEAKRDMIINVIDEHLAGKLSRMGRTFYYAGQQWEVNPLLLAAICWHETGRGLNKSGMLYSHNNAGGLFVGGVKTHFPSVESGIYEQARRLKLYYIDMGLTDIESIGLKYCPVGASNDPDNLNPAWVPGVTEHYKTLLEKCEGII